VGLPEHCPVNLRNHVWLVLNLRGGKGSVALFNVNPDWGIHKEAFDWGVQGIFFENEPPHIFTKGVLSILNKGLWFSSGAMAGPPFDEDDTVSLSKGILTELTPREKQILYMIASGGTNDKIAAYLRISPNTVKAHIYSIYQKIQVPNRLEAVRWVTKYL
jgi:DNA-binding NarL/FixJ family response regulator